MNENKTKISSPKTTIAGVAGLVALVANAVVALTDGNPATNPDWSLIATAAIGLIGLIFAKDADK